jgi:predicted nucleic acid-binding protein
VLVVDSSVWIDFFNARPGPARDALRAVLAHGEVRVVVPDLVLFEVLRGFRLERDLRQARLLMEAFSIENIAGPELALAAVAHYRALRQAGITVRSAVDVLVASFCIERGYALLHADRDYAGFEARRGLKSWRH